MLSYLLNVMGDIRIVNSSMVYFVWCSHFWECLCSQARSNKVHTWSDSGPVTFTLGGLRPAGREGLVVTLAQGPASMQQYVVDDLIVKKKAGS